MAYHRCLFSFAAVPPSPARVWTTSRYVLPLRTSWCISQAVTYLVAEKRNEIINNNALSNHVYR